MYETKSQLTLEKIPPSGLVRDQPQFRERNLF